MKFLVVILCSLFASVSAATGEVDKQFDKQCIGKYKCYFPSMCLLNPPADNFTSSVVVQGESYAKMSKNCVAVVRFYGYNKKWVRVVMESRDTARKPLVSKIIIHNKNKPLFSCEMKKGKLTALYSESDAAVKINEKESSLRPLKPLKCVFDVQLKGAEDKLPEFTNLPVKLEVNPDSKNNSYLTKSASLRLDFGDHCDPQRLKYSREYPDQRKEYSKAEYSVGELSCKEEFASQYLPKGGNAFVPVSLSCEGTQFMANGTPLPEDEDIAIRCAADARYSCPYEPKRDSSVFYRPSVREKSKSKAGEIKCLEGKFMFVRGKYSPGKIECLNREFSMRWVHIPFSGNETILHKTSPLVECRTELDCKTMNPIKRIQVKKGTLVNHVPQCANERGKLKLGSSLVDSVTCDSRTGQYMATLIGGGAAVRVEKDTEFECDYTNEEAVKEREGKKKKYDLWIIIAGSIAVALLVVAVCSFGIMAIKYKLRDMSIQKRHKKLLALNPDDDKKNKEEEVEMLCSKPLPAELPTTHGAGYLKITPANRKAAEARPKIPAPFDVKSVKWTEATRELIDVVKEKDVALKETRAREAKEKAEEEKLKEKKE